MIMKEDEKKLTAYHEAGHAIVGRLVPEHDPVYKVSIIPRGRALGVTWTLPNEDRLSMTRSDMFKQLSMMMGGRAAEEVALRAITGGASNDLLKATRMARRERRARCWISRNASLPVRLPQLIRPTR